MLKKMMLIAGLVLALAGVAGASSASAAGTLTHNGVPIPTGEHVTLDLSGEAAFAVELIGSSYACDVHAQVTLESGHPSTGEASFTVTTSAENPENCEGTGLLAGCELLEAPNTSPWHVDVTNDFDITGVELTNVFDEFCIAPETTLIFPEVTAVPNNAGAIESVTLSGEGEASGLGPATVSGVLSVEGEASGTYGVE